MNLLSIDHDDDDSPVYAYKASSTDPDTLSFDQAMADVENIDEWMKAANDEIKSLVKNGTWKEVSTDVAGLEFYLARGFSDASARPTAQSASIKPATVSAVICRKQLYKKPTHQW